jgi:hypothetical protein
MVQIGHGPCREDLRRPAEGMPRDAHGIGLVHAMENAVVILLQQQDLSRDESKTDGAWELHLGFVSLVVVDAGVPGVVGSGHNKALPGPHRQQRGLLLLVGQMRRVFSLLAPRAACNSAISLGLQSVRCSSGDRHAPSWSESHQRRSRSVDLLTYFLRRRIASRAAKAKYV